MKFRYRAYSRDGREKLGEIESPDKAQAMRSLASQGLSVFELGEMALQSSPRRSQEPVIQKSIFAGTKPDLGRLYADLALLTGAGLPVSHALRALSDTECSRPQQLALTKVLEMMNSGASAAASFASLAEIPQDALGMIASGESAGRMPEIFSALALQSSERLRLREQMLNALGYPAFLFVLMMLAISVLTFGLVPSIAPIFEESGQPAPFIVGWLTSLREGLSGGVASTVLLSGLVGLSLSFLPSVHKLYSAGLFRLLIKAPIFGPILRKSTLSRYLAGLGLLLENGTPMAKALKLSASCTNIEAFKSGLLTVKNVVSAGELLPSAMQKSGLFDQRIISLISVGDEANRLPDVIKRAAEILQTEAMNSIKRYTALLTPAMTILMGLLIGGLVVSVMTALLGINEIAIQ